MLRNHVVSEGSIEVTGVPTPLFPDRSIMADTGVEQPGAKGDAEINVTHFIPSVELKGTRADKLAKLDLLIDHLAALRRSLAEHQPPPPVWRAGPPMQLTRADRWWAAGLLLSAALVLLSLTARACGT